MFWPPSLQKCRRVNFWTDFHSHHFAFIVTGMSTMLKRNLCVCIVLLPTQRPVENTLRKMSNCTELAVLLRIKIAEIQGHKRVDKQVRFVLRNVNGSARNPGGALIQRTPVSAKQRRASAAPLPSPTPEAPTTRSRSKHSPAGAQLLRFTLLQSSF